MEKQPTTAYPLRLPTDLYNTLRAEAFARGVSVNALICGLLTEHVASTRHELHAIIAKAANERYAHVLDRLAEL